MLWVDTSLIEIGATIHSEYVFGALDSGENICLRRHRIGIWHANLIEGSDINDDTAFADVVGQDLSDNEARK